MWVFGVGFSTKNSIFLLGGPGVTPFKTPGGGGVRNPFNPPGAPKEMLTEASFPGGGAEENKGMLHNTIKPLQTTLKENEENFFLIH